MAGLEMWICPCFCLYLEPGWEEVTPGPASPASPHLSPSHTDGVLIIHFRLYIHVGNVVLKSVYIYFKRGWRPSWA